MKNSHKTKSDVYVDIAQKLAQAFITRASHFSIYWTQEKAKQSSKDTNKMFLEYVCFKIMGGEIILVLFGKNKFDLNVCRR